MKKILAFFLSTIFFLTRAFPCKALLSPQEERKIGQKVFLTLQKEAVFIQDPEVLNYIKQVGNRIVAHIGPHFFPIRFYVLKDESMNAFAVPGGFVFINSGLIEEVDRESELAGVIAHELAHVQARHIVRRIEQVQRLNLATIALTIAALLLSKGETAGIIATTANAAALTQILSYSREDEEEADRLAFRYMTKAGYDPRGLIEVFNKIIRHSWLLSENTPNYLLTHPSTPERISYLESLIANYRPKVSYHPDPIKLKRIQTRIKVETHDLGSLILYYQENLQKKPKNPFFHYGLGLSLRKMGRYKQALKEFKEVSKLLPSEDIFSVDIGETFFLAGNYSQAIKILKAFLIHHPGYTPAQYLLARSYQELGEYQQALYLFKKLERPLNLQPLFHYYWAQLYASIGKQGLSHYQFAEYFKLKGDIKTALYHLRQAYKSLSPNDPLRKKIEKILKKIPSKKK